MILTFSTDTASQASPNQPCYLIMRPSGSSAASSIVPPVTVPQIYMPPNLMSVYQPSQTLVYPNTISSPAIMTTSSMQHNQHQVISIFSNMFKSKYFIFMWKKNFLRENYFCQPQLIQFIWLSYFQQHKPIRSSEGYMNDLCLGYKVLKSVLSYLNAYELLNAACVCSMWRDLALSPSMVCILIDSLMLLTS